MGIGDFVSGIFGSKNEDKAKTHEVDANAYEYGGKPGGADAAAGRYNERAEDWKNKANEYGAQQGNLYNRGESAMNQQNDARGMQMDAASMARARATGQAPSIAQMQGDRAMGQAVAAQTSQMASARGPAALALAQQGAANNAANAQSDIAGQSAIAAAQERQAAEQAYAAQSGAIRGGDQGAAQTAYGAGAQAGQLGLGAGNLSLGYTGAEQNVRAAQMSGAQNREAQRSANANAVSGINAGVGGQNAAMNQQNGLALFGAGADTAGAAAGAIFSDANAKLPLASYVPSTWGAGPDTGAQEQAAQLAQVQSANAQSAFNQAEKEVSPYQKDVDHFRGIRKVSAALGQDARLSEDEQRQERYARMMTKQAPDVSGPDKTAAKDEKAAVVDGKAVPKPDAKAGAGSKVGAVLGGFGDKFSGGSKAVDVAYHGSSGGYVPPQLLAVSDVRSKVPSIGANGGAAGGPASATGPITHYAMKDGGIDVMGTFKKQNAEIDKNRRDPTGGMMSDVTSKQPMMVSDTVGKQPFALSDMIGKMTLSDDRAKLAAAWDEGHAAAVSDVKKLAGKKPDELKALSDKRPVAAAVRDVKADAWDEGKRDPRPRQQVSFQRNPDAPTDDRNLVEKVSGDIAMNPAYGPGVNAMGAAGLVGSALGRDIRAKLYGERGEVTTSDSRAKKGVSDAEAARLSKWADGEMAKVGGADAASKWADEELARTRAATEAIDKGRPAADPMADAARAMRASTYAYKPEMTPPEQSPGEPNVGPMAQTMASSPVTATAIKKDPKTGMLMIDQAKMLKVLGGVAAHQQSQIDALASKRRKG